MSKEKRTFADENLFAHAETGKMSRREVWIKRKKFMEKVYMISFQLPALYRWQPVNDIK